MVITVELQAGYVVNPIPEDMHGVLPNTLAILGPWDWHISSSDDRRQLGFKFGSESPSGQ
jgi:hypothetical protein